MKPRFNINDLVIYKNKGACRITGIEKKSFSYGEEKEYYTISGARDDQYKSFVPVDSDAAGSMRPVPTPKEAEDIIERGCVCRPEYEDDKKQRAEYYRSVMQRDDPVELLGLYLMLAQRKTAVQKMPAADMNMMSYAEKTVSEQLYIPLDTDKPRAWEKILCIISEKIK